MRLNNEMISSIKWLVQLADLRSLFSLILMLLNGFLQGAGILMIIPLLSLLGIGNSLDDAKIIYVKKVFNYFHLPITIESVVLLFFGFVLFQALVKYFNSNLSAKITQNYSNRLRKRMHLAILESNWMLITKSRQADLIGALSREINQVAFGVSTIFQLISIFIILTIHVILASFIAFKFTLLICFGAMVIFLFQRKLFSLSYRGGKNSLESMKDLQNSLQELFNNIKQAKSMGAKDQQIHVFNAVSDQVYDNSQKMSKSRALGDFSFEIASAIFISFFLLLVFYIKINHTIDLILILYLFSRILPGVKSLINQFNMLFSIIPAIYDVKEKIVVFESEKEQDISDKNNLQLNDAVSLVNVHFSYPQKKIFKGINLLIPANKITVLTGPSGGGKSTLADIITGLHTPLDGKMLIDGKSLNQVGLSNWRNVVSYMPQECLLLHDSIRANICWSAPQLSEQEIWQVLEKAEAKEFVEKLPLGLDTVVGDKGTRISGGQRQRIALARALARKPKLLILDEATNALDQENESKIFDAVFKLKDTTVLIITHRKNLLEKAHHAYLIEEGNISSYQSKNNLF